MPNSLAAPIADRRAVQAPSSARASCNTASPSGPTRRAKTQVAWFQATGRPPARPLFRGAENKGRWVPRRSGRRTAPEKSGTARPAARPCPADARPRSAGPCRRNQRWAARNEGSTDRSRTCCAVPSSTVSHLPVSSRQGTIPTSSVEKGGVFEELAAMTVFSTIGGGSATSMP